MCFTEHFPKHSTSLKSKKYKVIAAHTLYSILVFGEALQESLFLLDKHIWHLHWVKC